MTRRSSDESAAEWIGPLYDRFAAGLYRYAVMVLADPAAASDAVQEVFAGIIDRLPRIDDAEHYLRRAVRNECYSTLRRRRSQDRAISESPLLEPIADCADPGTRLMIDQALRRLPAEQREVLYLKVYEGMTFQEIAAAIGEPLNTVASRYRYALEKLRTQLGASR